MNRTDARSFFVQQVGARYVVLQGDRTIGSSSSLADARRAACRYAESAGSEAWMWHQDGKWVLIEPGMER